MPQSKEVHKEYMRVRRKGSQEGSQISPESLGFTKDKEGKYAPIIYALADPVKREKLRKICLSLSGKETHRKGYLENVWYGIGDRPVTMKTVSNLLEAVK